MARVSPQRCAGWVRNRYQFMVLDCPPALDLLTLNALVAADSVLIPMQAEYFALEGISELLEPLSASSRHSIQDCRSKAWY